MFPGKEEFKSESEWMSELPPALHNNPLWSIAIPGSHDSMSYDLDINSSIVEPDQLKGFSKICCVRKIVRKWAVTQEENIISQLNAGVRYFDLRIALKPDDTGSARLYFYHGLFTLTDVETILGKINDWALEHHKEILILALSHFKGCDEAAHNHLIQLIKTLFGSKLFLRQDTPTLNRCWEQRRNVIVSYDYPPTSTQHPELWGKIAYCYGNTMDPAMVESKLRQVLEQERPSKCFFACGLNLTLPGDPTALRRSLPELVSWVGQQGRQTPMNIVASDLVTCDDFVSTVIKLNYSQ
ncbi:PI-PLC X domain-containing protein 1-like [Aulostomus maculatus]